MKAGDWKLKIGNWRLKNELREAAVCWQPILQFPIVNFQFSISNAFDPARQEASECP